MRIPAPFSYLIAALSAAVALSGCGSTGQGSSTTESSSGPQQISTRTDYNNTKSMVMDILHSKQGKDGLKELFKDPTFKQEIAINEHDVNQALIKAMTSGPNKNLIETQMKDPVFAKAMVQAAKKEHTDLLKTLIKDPEYQNQILALLKSPSFQQTLIPLMQTPEYRQAIMKIMLDSLQNPEFKVMFMETVKDAIRSGAGVSKLDTGGSANKKDQAQAQKSMSTGDSKSDQKDKGKKAETADTDKQSEDNKPQGASQSKPKDDTLQSTDSSSTDDTTSKKKTDDESDQ